MDWENGPNQQLLTLMARRTMIFGQLSPVTHTHAYIQLYRSIEKQLFKYKCNSDLYNSITLIAHIFIV